MSHISKEQRYTISVMLQAGHKQNYIAETIGKHKSVVCREIKRNADLRSKAYVPELAHRKATDRIKGKPKHKRFTAEILTYVKEKLALKYSPEQIAGEAKVSGIPCVSHETIYCHIWADKKKGGVLHENLRNKGRKYRKRGALKDKRGRITDRVDISERPPVVEERNRFGDLEIDTIIGKDHKGAIVTINDRATGMVRIKKLNGKDADELAAAAIKMLTPWMQHLHTITADNGKEFASHTLIAKALNIEFYFARPYHSWERGSNENLNGLIRQYIPKKTDFSTITDEYISYIEKELNCRPRKRFNFEPPIKIFNKKVAFVA